MLAPSYEPLHPETPAKETKPPPENETVKDQSPQASEQTGVSNQVTDDSKDLTTEKEVEGGEEEEEEEGECGFCLYMKGGGCKAAFISWENCIKEVEKNPNDSIAEKCFEVSSALMQCMSAHTDYYAPVLQAEERVNKELEKEAESNEGSLEKEVTIEVPREAPSEGKQGS